MEFSKELFHSYLYAKQFLSPSLRRCVGVNCEKFLRGSPENPHLLCQCGAEVCFNCGDQWHPDQTCEQVFFISNTRKGYKILL